MGLRTRSYARATPTAGALPGNHSSASVIMSIADRGTPASQRSWHQSALGFSARKMLDQGSQLVERPFSGVEGRRESGPMGGLGWGIAAESATESYAPSLTRKSNTRLLSSASAK